MGSFNIGTLFAVLAMKDQLSGPMTQLASTVRSKSGEVGTAVEGVAVKIGNVNKLIKDFSGLPVMQRAEEYAAAVQRIGGASKLTATEQQRVNAAVTEAINKYKALGQEAPGHLIALQKETTNVATAWERADGLLGKFGLSLRGVGAGAVVGTVVKLAKEAFVAAGNLSDLSASTGLTTRELQRLEIAGVQTGVSVDSSARAINRLQRSLVEGDAGAVGALAKLNLNIGQLTAMSPGAMFDTMARAISGVTDPTQRTAIAMQLLGRSGTELLPMILADIDKLNEGTVRMSERSVRAFDAIGDAWDKLKITARNVVGELVAIAAETVIDPTSLAKRLANQFTFGGSLEDLVAKEREIQANRAKSGFGQNINLADLRTYAERLQDLQEEVATLDLAERAEIATALRLGVAQSELATKYKVSEGAIRLYVSQVKESTKAQREVNPLILTLAKDAAELNKQFLAAKASSAGLDYKRVTEEVKKLVERGGLPLLNAELRTINFLMAAQRVGFASLITMLNGGTAAYNLTTAAALKYAEMLGRINKAIKPGGSQGILTAPGMPGSIDMSGDAFNAPEAPSRLLERWTRALDLVGGGFVDLAKVAGDQIDAIVQGVGTALQSVRQMMSGWAQATAGGFVNALAGGLGLVGGAIQLGRTIGRALGIGGTAGRDQVESFAQSMGGFDALHAQLAQLGDEGERLWVMLTQGVGRNNPREAEAAINTVRNALERFTEEERRAAETAAALQGKVAELLDATEAFGGRAPAALHPMIQSLLEMTGLTEEQRRLFQGLLQPADWEAQADAAGRLGINVKSLGASFQQARISDQALQAVRDLNLLSEAGVLTDAAMKDAAAGLNALVLDAIASGAVLPETLRPYLERLAEMGLLVDEAGNKIDLAGVKFADIPDDALLLIVDILTEIRDILASLGGVARDSADEINEAFSTIKPPKWDLPGQGGGQGGDAPPGGEGGAPGFAGGTRGRYLDFGSGTPVVLHGRERVMTEAEGRREAGVTVNVTINAIDGASVERVVSSREFAEAFDRAAKLNTHGVGTAVRQVA